jgi:hypothetical protein
MLRQGGLSRLPRLSLAFLSFPENPCPAERPQQHRSEGAYRAYRASFLGGWSIVGASHANLLQTMYQPVSNRPYSSYSPFSALNGARLLNLESSTPGYMV